MKFFLSIFVLIGITTATMADSLVVTIFEPKIIGDYYFQLKSKNSKLTTEVHTNLLFNYCHLLRQSRMFHMTNSETISLGESSIQYKIAANDLRTENDEIKIEETELSIGGAKSPPQEKIPTFKCLDIRGQPSWFVTASFVDDFAFLFTTVPKSPYALEKQNQNLNLRPKQRQRKAEEVLIRLTGIIDEPATLIDATNAWENFVHSSKNHGLDGEILCKVDPILQYRLCAISADVMNAIQTTIIEDPITDQYYRDRSFNSYIRQDSIEANCPEVNVNLPEGSTLTAELLYCSGIIDGSPYDFYLSQNMLESSTAFIVQDSTIREIYLPLLINLSNNNVDKLFQNLTLK